MFINDRVLILRLGKTALEKIHTFDQIHASCGGNFSVFFSFFFFRRVIPAGQSRERELLALGLCGPWFNPTRFHSIRKPGSALTIGSHLSEGDFCPIY